jgi:hypothetical protein
MTTLISSKHFRYPEFLQHIQNWSFMLVRVHATPDLNAVTVKTTFLRSFQNSLLESALVLFLTEIPKIIGFLDREKPPAF